MVLCSIIDVKSLVGPDWPWHNLIKMQAIEFVDKGEGGKLQGYQFTIKIGERRN